MPRRPPSYRGPSAQVFVVDTTELLTFPLQHYTSIRDDMRGSLPVLYRSPLYLHVSAFITDIIILSLIFPLMLQIPALLPLLPPAVVLSP